jgi:hypothetical protein
MLPPVLDLGPAPCNEKQRGVATGEPYPAMMMPFVNG